MMHNIKKGCSDRLMSGMIKEQVLVPALLHIYRRAKRRCEVQYERRKIQIF